ncbi:MAG: hypothetical protein IAE85_16985 [Anaerolinea sp.]|nr:hypothetical protein [Anaerolinea sp.]
MAVHPVTINLSESVYRQIKRAADVVRRPVDEVVAEAVVAAAPIMDISTSSLRMELAQMAYLNDAALWKAARATLSKEQRQQLETLHDKQQRVGLTPGEQAQEEALRKLYRETLLVRAQAVALLQQRGYDVSDPRAFQPLG